LCQLTRDGEVYHDYCLNYPKAVCYLEQLRKNEDFGEFEKVSVDFTATLDDGCLKKGLGAGYIFQMDIFKNVQIV